MGADVTLKAEDAIRLSKALKAAGSNGKGSLRTELHKGLQAAVKPVLPKATDALAAAMPSGVQARARRTKQAVQVKTGADPGIRIAVRYVKRGAGLGASNVRLANRAGVIRHPVFGNRERWVNTRVPGARGWFDETYKEAAPLIRPGIEQVMQDVAEKVVRGVR